MSKRSFLNIFAGAAVFFSVSSLVWAQGPQINPDVYSQLRHRYIGPVGNRVTAVSGVPGSPYIYYVGAASGGIFKSSDGGIQWEPIFDGQPVSSIGSLAVAPSDSNMVWAGTGESFIRSHISVGAGIYRSLDAGKNWTLMGLEKTGRIGNVVVDPRNPDIVFACALGHAYGPQPDRGVFRTADGGKTWSKVLFVDENTGCSDMTMDPNNSRVLFAGMWQMEIHTWGRTSGGPGSGLFKSTDGGLTWKRLEGHGLPRPPVGRIAVQVAQRDSNRVYAMIETGDGDPMDGKPTQRGQLWRSDDGGENWQLVNSDRNIRGRTHYYTREKISPDNENEVYFFSAAFSRTLDGGRTLTPMPSNPGGDNHEMWIDPANGDRMAVVNDGGVSISINRGRTWHRVQLPIAQIYHVTVDNQIPYFVYGNRQDGPSFRGPSNSLQFGGFGGGGFGGGIPRSVWHPVAGSESGFATPDPVDNNIIWSTGTGSGSVGGAVARFDERNHQAREVEVWPEDVSGASAGEVKYRFNWEFPVTISPHDHNKVYVGSQYVHVTTDGGQSWQVISQDLTRNDKSRQGVSGGLTPDNIGVEYAGVVFAIAESPKEPGLIWAGTNDGLVQITRDAGKTWNNITKNIPDLPEWGTVSNIEASRYDAGTAYISVDFHQVNNRDPFAYKTTDYGRTWTKITSGIPPSMLSYAHCIREDPVRKGLLYLGTENALYVSFDDGKNWQPLQNNLPHAPVYWIAVQERFHDLALATYGRGFWILDDLTPLQQLTPEVLASNAHLFAPRDAYRFRPVAQPGAVSYDPTSGQNPPYGASLNFYLKSKLGERERVRITISDAAGKVVRELTCNPPRPEGAPPPTPGGPGGGGGGGGFGAAAGPPCEAKPGINRIWWDLRTEPSTQVRLRTAPLYAPDVPLGPEGWRAAPAVGRISILVPPGTYTVKMAAAGQESVQKLNVLKDPHSSGTDSDIAAQVQLASALRDEMNTMAESVNQIESIRVQLANLEKELGKDETADAIRKASEGLANRLIGVEGKMLQLKLTGRGQDDVRWAPMLLQKISYLAGQVGGSADFPPTTQQVAVHAELKQQADKCRQELQDVLAKDVAAFNAMLRERNISNIIAKTP